MANIKKLVPITGTAVAGESYDGKYTVTPSRSAQILSTANRVDITQYYTKAEVDELIAKAIAEAMGTNGGGYFWKSVKEE